jgi:hypothetical protein
MDFFHSLSFSPPLSQRPLIPKLCLSAASNASLLAAIAIVVVVAIVIGLLPSFPSPLGYWLLVIRYWIFPPPFPAAVSAAINSQAMLERGHQFPGYA